MDSVAGPSDKKGIPYTQDHAMADHLQAGDCRSTAKHFRWEDAAGFTKVTWCQQNGKYVKYYKVLSEGVRRAAAFVDVTALGKVRSALIWRLTTPNVVLIDPQGYWDDLAGFYFPSVVLFVPPIEEHEKKESGTVLYDVASDRNVWEICNEDVEKFAEGAMLYHIRKAVGSLRDFR